PNLARHGPHAILGRTNFARGSTIMAVAVPQTSCDHSFDLQRQPRLRYSSQPRFGDSTMRGLAALTCLAVVFATSAAEIAAAEQPAANGCATEQKPGAAQTLRCRDGLTIV